VVWQGVLLRVHAVPCRVGRAKRCRLLRDSVSFVEIEMKWWERG